MGIFDSENSDENEENQQNENEQDDNQNRDTENESQGDREKSQQEQDQDGIDADYDLDEYRMDEQLVDTDSDQQSSEKVIQKMNASIEDREYKIFTSQFDEISMAENLDSKEEIHKLRKSLDQQLTRFQDLITK